MGPSLAFSGAPCSLQYFACIISNVAHGGNQLNILLRNKLQQGHARVANLEPIAPKPRAY